VWRDAFRVITRSRLTGIVPATNQPSTLDRCLTAIRRASDPPEDLIIVDQPANSGPALARNLGARRARGEVLVFVDADIEVHPDVFRRIRAHFDRDRGLAALFGSYDDDPAAPGVVSSFRNLLHHWVHQANAGAATTFWAGLGAVRRDAFLSLAGFDHWRFAGPSIEDIELGMRMSAAGGRIELDPDVLGKHLKRWTVIEMVRTDIFQRGGPWVALLVATRSHSTALNLGWRHRLSALSCLAAAGLLAERRPRAALAGLAFFTALNASFYRFLLRRGGVKLAAAGIPLHLLHHLAGAAALPVGLVMFLRSDRGRPRGTLLDLESLPGGRKRTAH
jgi:glycosyltransferase involved in cell wall biosynthesis